jgi:hypothetical protein
MSEETPSAQELAEAEALAQALEGNPAFAAPSDALEAAALLRYTRGADQASAESLQRVREAVTPGAVGPARRRPPRAVPRSALVLGLFAAAAALALAYVPVFTAQRAPAASESARVAAPTEGRESEPSRDPPLQALLTAEGAALLRPDAPLDDLVEATTRHRQGMLAQLAERYGGSP